MPKKRMALISAVAFFATAGGGYYLWQKRSADDAHRLRVSGAIEISEAELSFKLPGRVAEVLKEEGDRVQAGEQIARLEDEELRHQVELQAAQVQAAEALLAELLAGARPEERAQAAAAVRAAEADFKRIQDDYLRLKDLYQKGSTSEREYDAARTAYTVAQTRLDQAREQLALVRQGPREEKIAQARANLEQARAALALAQTRLDSAVLTSPLSGVVLARGVGPGEYAAPGTPVVTVGEIEKVYLRAYVEESDLGRVKLGQPVKVSADSYPGKVYAGKITFISPAAEFTPKNVQTQKERVKLVYRIKVDIPNPAQELKPGMPAEAEIIWEGEAD